MVPRYAPRSLTKTLLQSTHNAIVALGNDNNPETVYRLYPGRDFRQI